LFRFWNITMSQGLILSCGTSPRTLCVMMFFSSHFTSISHELDLLAYNWTKNYLGYSSTRVTKMHKVQWWDFNWNLKTLEGPKSLDLIQWSKNNLCHRQHIYFLSNKCSIKTLCYNAITISCQWFYQHLILNTLLKCYKNTNKWKGCFVTKTLHKDISPLSIFIFTKLQAKVVISNTCTP